MKTSVKTIGLLAALAVGLPGPLFSQVPDLTKDTQSVDRAATYSSQKMPWDDPSYAKDIPATQADSRAEERAKGGWTEFIRHHEDRKKWVTGKKVDILMIGDSIVFGWSREGHEVWNEHDGNRNAVNIGSSGDTTSHMLWHIQDDGLDGMKGRNPEVVVIMIGTNNRGEPANEGRDTAQGVLAILKEVHHRLPELLVK